MAVISVVGTSGVGKSFLVKQLAALTNNPALFEGEEGTIPEEILRNIFSGDDPTQRFHFFIDRFETMLKKARKISDQGIDCYVDGANISPEVIIKDEDNRYHENLFKFARKLDPLSSDCIILLTADRKFLTQKITERKRHSESHEESIERAMRVQETFITHSQRYDTIIQIDRSHLEFTDPNHLTVIMKKIREKV